MVLPFAGVELALVGMAFLFYARHAADREQISLHDGELVVEWDHAGQHSRSAFRRDWVRVEPSQADGSLIELSAHGTRARVGRYLRPEARLLLAHEIRWALRNFRVAAAGQGAVA